MNDTSGKAPGWASFLEPEEWAVFVATLATDLARRGLRYDIDGDTGALRFALPPGTRVPNVLGLQSIAQVCHARPRRAWAEAIAHHFDVALESRDGETADALAGDWSRAKEVVKLRLYEEDDVPGVPIVSWRVAERLVAVLSFDLPDTVISVRRDDRARWDVADRDLFDVALANVKRAGRLQGGDVDIGGGTRLHVLEGPHEFFAATHALLLGDYLREATPNGAVVAIPNRHVVLYHPLVDQRAVRAIHRMIASAGRMYTEGPGSISADLYWWRPPADAAQEPLVRLACERERDGVRFSPPAEFTSLLSSLSPPRDER